MRKSSLWHNVTWYIQSITFTRHCIYLFFFSSHSVSKGVSMFQHRSFPLSLAAMSVSIFIFRMRNELVGRKTEEEENERKEKSKFGNHKQQWHICLCTHQFSIETWMVRLCDCARVHYIYNFHIPSLVGSINTSSNYLHTYTKLYNCASCPYANVVDTYLFISLLCASQSPIDSILNLWLWVVICVGFFCKSDEAFLFNTIKSVFVNFY